MAKVLFVVISSLLFLSTAAKSLEEPGLQQNSSLVQCLNGTIGLEKALFKVSVELATGIFIRQGIEDLKVFWSLFLDWLQTCKLYFESFFSTQMIKTLSRQEFMLKSIEIEGNLYTSKAINEVYDFKDCSEAIDAVIERVNELEGAMNSKDYQTMIDLVQTFKPLSQEVSHSCED
jgi:hypothetical protein